MPAEPEVTLDQVRDILEMLRRTIEGASQLAGRVEVLEKAVQQTYKIVETVQDHQTRIMEGFERHTSAQNKLNEDLARAVGEMSDRLDYLEGRKQVM